MARKKSNKALAQIGFRIDPELADRFKKYCSESHTTRSKMIRTIFNGWFETLIAKNEKA